MAMRKPDEAQWRVDMPKQVYDGFLKVIESRGMTQKGATARLLAAFLSLDSDIQGMMLGQLTPARAAKLARAILREMAKR